MATFYRPQIIQLPPEAVSRAKAFAEAVWKKAGSRRGNTPRHNVF
jgi:hypothetical protein